jgi:hypothetical protein
MIEEIGMTNIEHKLCEQALAGNSGEMLIELIIDKYLLQTTGPDKELAMQKVGIGRVIKFMRSVREGSDNIIISKPKPQTKTK